MKKYKPGQFVSIDGKRARVCKNKSCGVIHICDVCHKVNGIVEEHCNFKEECITKLGDDLPYGNYPLFLEKYAKRRNCKDS